MFSKEITRFFIQRLLTALEKTGGFRTYSTQHSRVKQGTDKYRNAENKGVNMPMLGLQSPGVNLGVFFCLQPYHPGQTWSPHIPSITLHFVFETKLLIEPGPMHLVNSAWSETPRNPPVPINPPLGLQAHVDTAILL